MNNALDSRDRDRYSRQLMVDSIGEDEQQALHSSRVLVVGAGGLGSASIPYLAGAGVGTIGIADDGVVKRSNLHRQIGYRVDDVGKTKVDSVARFVEARNPAVTIEKHGIRIEPSVAESVISSYDIVVDGLDDFTTRYLVNDVARIEDIPFVHGAVYGFEGQCTTFVPGGPCYRCLVPEPSGPAVAPAGEPIGVVGPIPGIVGCLQATEVIKYVTDIGNVLTDRLLRYDGLDATIDRIPIERSPNCPLCGDGEIDTIDDMNYR